MNLTDSLYNCISDKCHQGVYGKNFDSVAKLFMPATFEALEFKTQNGDSVHCKYNYTTWRNTRDVGDIKRALGAYYQQEHAHLMRHAAKDAVLRSALGHIDEEDLGVLLVEQGLSKTIRTLKARPVPTSQNIAAKTESNTIEAEHRPISQPQPTSTNVVKLTIEAPADDNCANLEIEKFESQLEQDIQQRAKRQADFYSQYAQSHPNHKFSGIVGIFGSHYKPNEIAPSPIDANTPNSSGYSSQFMPLANVQYTRTLKDNSNLESVYTHGDKVRKTTELGIAGSWRFHWGFEKPLLLTPRRAAVTINRPVLKTQDNFGNISTHYVGAWSGSIGLMANDPLLTATRPMIYPNTKPVGDCGCVGGFTEDQPANEVKIDAETCALPVKPVMRKPETTLLAFNADSGEFGITGLGGKWTGKHYTVSASASPKGLPKFKPSLWNEMPKPITDIFAATAMVTYKPQENLLLGAQASVFGAENRLSLIGRKFWPQGTNAALALDYGRMPNRTNEAQIERMGIVRGVLEVPLTKTTDIGILGSAGRYFDTDKNYLSSQLSVTYKPKLNTKLPMSINFAAGRDSRYGNTVNIGVITNLK